MNFKKPLFWHQGLFLQPQHFQYQSLYQQQEQYQWFNVQNGFAWGAVSLQFDQQALSRGNVELTQFDVLFEDGALISFPDNVQIGARNFDNHWLDRAKPLVVYLALPKMSNSQSNVTQVAGYDNDQPINTRFVSLVEGEEVTDLHQGGQGVAVKSMKFAARLIFESELEEFGNYVVQPLAKLTANDDDITFAKDFIPASITIKASTVLMDTLKDIRDELIGRAKQLENYKSTTTSRTAEFNPVAERYRNALRVIARYAPVLNHFLEDQNSKPFDVFGQLRALVGELTTFSEGYSILGESTDGQLSALKYNHRDLFGCFDSCKSLIITLLDKLTVSPELLVKLNKEAEGHFVGKLPAEFFGRQNSMYLVLETGMPVSDFINSFLTFAKLGSQEQVEQFVQRAIPGVHFEHFDEQPTGLERRPKVSYFVIDRSSPQWKAVEEQGLFALQWDEAPEDLSVEMVLVRG